MEMKLDFDEFYEHINQPGIDQYQVGDDPMAVCGPMTNDMECLSLRNIVLNHLPPGNIIEIGAWLGLSTITLALSLKEKYPDYVMYSIDPHSHQHSMDTDATSEYFKNAPDGFSMRETYIDNLHKWNISNVYAEKIYSQEFDTKIIPDPISMVFIDGDHSRKAVFNDLQKYAPLICEGGFIILHDKNDRVVQDGVTDFLILEKKYELVDMIPELLEQDKKCDQRGYKEMLYVYKKQGKQND
jgi:predicted O-methyltransferase YrrM